MDKTRLLLLDINGVLCCKSKTAVEDDELEVLNLKNYKVIMRPGSRQFLDFCYKNYTVAFYSSTTYPNANAILEELLSTKQKSITAFRWFRDRTRLDPDYLKDEKITQYDTIKKLTDVFDNPSINSDRKYNVDNTILCDDSSTKTRFNDPKNIVILEPFTGDKEDKVLYELMETISQKFADLSDLSSELDQLNLN